MQKQKRSTSFQLISSLTSIVIYFIQTFFWKYAVVVFNIIIAFFTNFQILILLIRASLLCCFNYYNTKEKVPLRLSRFRRSLQWEIFFFRQFFLEVNAVVVFVVIVCPFTIQLKYCSSLLFWFLMPPLLLSIAFRYCLLEAAIVGAVLRIFRFFWVFALAKISVVKLWVILLRKTLQYQYISKFFGTFLCRKCVEGFRKIDWTLSTGKKALKITYYHKK